MHAWEQIQQVIDHLEEHLGEDYSMEELAQMASLSPFYFQRLFSRLVKKPLAEYIKLRRMAKATQLLQTDEKIVDVALALGFSTQQHFSRTFKETFGLTPAAFRKQPVALNHMTKPQLSLAYTLVEEGMPLISDGMVLEIQRQTLDAPLPFAGIETELPAPFVDGLGTESGVDPLYTLWQEFHGQKSKLLGQGSGGAEDIGVALPSQMEGFFRYFAGTLYSKAPVPEGFTSWILPAGEYIVCHFEAESFETLVMDALYKAQRYVFETWLPCHKLQTEPFCAERYQSHSPQTTQMEFWLKLMV